MSGIERCEAEQHEIFTRPDVLSGEAPEWLVLMGWADWEIEKQLRGGGDALHVPRLWLPNRSEAK